MSKKIEILKDEQHQQSVPDAWKETFRKIVDALKDGDYHKMPGIDEFSQGSFEVLLTNLKRYGAHLVSLPEESWETSVCQWMGRYWDVLIDLYTVEEGASDLVLSVRVYESGREYIFKVLSVYVP